MGALHTVSKGMNMFRHIAYVSLSLNPLTPELLSNILQVSQSNNRRDKITGILMFHDMLFFQVLEGEHSVVERCYVRIVQDPRHTNVSLMLDSAAQNRTFPDWAMAYAGPDEVGQYTQNSIKSLADLKSGKDATEASNSLAFKLADSVFRNSRHLGY